MEERKRLLRRGRGEDGAEEEDGAAGGGTGATGAGAGAGAGVGAEALGKAGVELIGVEDGGGETGEGAGEGARAFSAAADDEDGSMVESERCGRSSVLCTKQHDESTTVRMA